MLMSREIATNIFDHWFVIRYYSDTFKDIQWQASKKRLDKRTNILWMNCLADIYMLDLQIVSEYFDTFFYSQNLFS